MKNCKPMPREEIDRLRASDAVCITPREAANVLQCAPYLLTLKAKDGQLPFPAFFIGNRLRIPRIPFLRYIGYEMKGDNSNDV